tara:strand:+ start:1197 stop:1421 length:225 start_codon:yes stop_codon:yes gene_type:complete
MSDIKKLLTNLHTIVCEELLNRIVSDEASTADIVAAIRLLKDNGITSTPEASAPLRNLAKSVPFEVVEDLREVN